MPARVFVSYDRDHDEDRRQRLVERLEELALRVEGSSAPIASLTWSSATERAIRHSDRVVVLCGAQTDTASGVAQELAIARALRRPYVLVAAANSDSVPPSSADEGERLVGWDEVEQVLTA